jgi:hypothetical protein
VRLLAVVHILLAGFLLSGLTASLIVLLKISALLLVVLLP